MADAADHVYIYRRLANLLSEKLDLSYGEVMGWIRCKLSFALVAKCCEFHLSIEFGPQAIRTYLPEFSFYFAPHVYMLMPIILENSYITCVITY